MSVFAFVVDVVVNVIVNIGFVVLSLVLKDDKFTSLNLRCFENEKGCNCRWRSNPMWQA